MRRAFEAIMIIIGAAAALLLFLPHLRASSGEPARPFARQSATFHSGKAAVAAPSGGCGGTGCHGGAPHLGGGGMAAFRNLHGGKVECAACHGKSGKGSWTAGRGGYVLSSTLPPASAADPHGNVGKGAPACRECHSREGAALLRAAGAASLSAAFADPMAIRMMEGGARKW